MSVHIRTPSGFDISSNPLFSFPQMPESPPPVSPDGDGSVSPVAPPYPAQNSASGGGPVERMIFAAMKVQKVYRSYRMRRMLADSAVVAEQLWWQAINFARLSHSTILFFNFSKPEKAAFKWKRSSFNASKVGKGLSKDAKAQKLAFQHWIEAIDPRHRYGHFLHMYYEEWCRAEPGQPFFYWLDVGEGKKVELNDCPRSVLQQQCIKYLGPLEREHFQYIVEEGKLVHKESGDFLDTTKGQPRAKWIFVMSTSEKIYCGRKKKGVFHHSSFLAGGATLAAGRLEVEDGALQSLSPHSGHYRPTDENLESFLSFLEKNDVNIDQVEIRSTKDDYEKYEESKPNKGEIYTELSIDSESSQSTTSNENKEATFSESARSPKNETKSTDKRNLFWGLQSPGADVAKEIISKLINSKNAASSYQLGNKLERKWCTEEGPRNGCVNDYPVELRLQALELVKLSSRMGSPTSNGHDFSNDHSISSF